MDGKHWRDGFELPIRHPHFIGLRTSSETIPNETFIIRWGISWTNEKWLVVKLIINIVANMDFSVVVFQVAFKPKKQIRLILIRISKDQLTK